MQSVMESPLPEMKAATLPDVDALIVSCTSRAYMSAAGQEPSLLWTFSQGVRLPSVRILCPPYGPRYGSGFIKCVIPKPCGNGNFHVESAVSPIA